jgi:hypothetical protein
VKYTLAVTSCNRFDLLKQTLESFAATADIAPEQTIIVNDAHDVPDWLGTLTGLGEVRWISNGRRRGQIFTLDRLYDEIKTERVFHLEDDWLFRPGGDYVARSFHILDRWPHVWSVSLRGEDCNGHPLVRDPISGLSVNAPGWREGWGGCHFNPGARRMSDYRRIGSYGRHVGYGTYGCGHELELSKMHLAMGYCMVALAKSIEHLGVGKSKAIEPLPPHPRVLIAVPVAQKYEYGPHKLPVERITDGRVTAVRNTWFQDARKFPNVDARFFYGEPVRDSDRDEIFVNAPDDYVGLSHKIKEICRYALAKGYEFLVKADDDTVLHIDRLLRSGFDSVDQMGYFGCTHAPGTCSCYATGMCYTLSRRAMELVVNAPITHWAEDLWVGWVLRTHGIRPVHNPGWLPGFDKHYVDFPLPSGTVAAHSVKPADVLAWHEALNLPCTGRVNAPKVLL